MRKPFDYFDNSYKCVPYWDATDSEKRIVRGIINGEYSMNGWHCVVGEVDNKSLEWHMRTGDLAKSPKVPPGGVASPQGVSGRDMMPEATKALIR